ncbi:F0F1 ATP synthase subunit delta [Paenibacillus silviterrae]|uniref:F0F1 ATP synthase subunit delta n=1 Tax=Paenibacillus silviterrae TaxID=3242194 RepID=UPI002543EEB8|nr:F0F1 ATP synthase subunit delta [Paenibacillus chinjuensis]
MSKDIIVAKRYAKALFAAAKDQNLVQQVEAELKAIIAVLQEQRDLHKLIQHPGVDVSAKTNLLKEIFGGTVSELVFATLVLLVERRREGALEAVVDSYVAIANEALGQANATVYTPVALSETELSGIAAAFSQITGKQIRVESVLDKSLLGGIQVRIGDRLYDGSLSGKLQRLEKTLNQSQAL